MQYTLTDMGTDPQKIRYARDMVKTVTRYSVSESDISRILAAITAQPWCKWVMRTMQTHGSAPVTRREMPEQYADQESGLLGKLVAGGEMPGVLNTLKRGSQIGSGAVEAVQKTADLVKEPPPDQYDEQRDEAEQYRKITEAAARYSRGGVHKSFDQIVAELSPPPSTNLPLIDRVMARAQQNARAGKYQSYDQIVADIS
jgi:hypothetical protein